VRHGRQVECSIVARYCDVNLGPLVTDPKLCTMVKARKKPVSSESRKA
jgi:hypothetical protein